MMGEEKKAPETKQKYKKNQHHTTDSQPAYERGLIPEVKVEHL